MSLAQTLKTFFAKEAEKITKTQAAQEAFQAALTTQAQEKGLIAVTRARNPFTI